MGKFLVSLCICFKGLLFFPFYFFKILDIKKTVASKKFHFFALEHFIKLGYSSGQFKRYAKITLLLSIVLYVVLLSIVYGAVVLIRCCIL